MADRSDGKTVGLRISYPMDMKYVTQELMMFKKGETINEIIRKIRNMGGIESCSCERIVPQK